MTETTGNFGYGQQGPNTSTSEYNVQAFVVWSILARVRTILLAKVVAVSNDGSVAAPGTVDVQPLVNMLDGQNNATPHGTIFGLPYCRLQGGGNAVILDPKVGDIGLVGICDRDISAVKSSKQAANPGSARKFALPDGIYIAGLFGDTPSQTVRFSEAGIEIKSAAEVKIVAPTVRVEGDLHVTGDVTGEGAIAADGNITAGQGGADQVTLQEHIHAADNTPPTPGH